MIGQGPISAGGLFLTNEEVRVLAAGLVQWCGPARCTNEFAIAMGYESSVDLPSRCIQIRTAVVRNESLWPMDWARALLATEIAFASDVMGAGTEWFTTTGLKDESTITTLRSIQRKLGSTVFPLVGHELGTRSTEF